MLAVCLTSQSFLWRKIYLRCARMFGKSGSPPKKGGLADRVRQVAAREASPNLAQPRIVRPVQSKQREERRHIYRNGFLTLDNGSRLNVTIKDLSSAGARVEFFVKMVLPSPVLLVEPTLGLRTWARVIWQQEGVAGLKFLADDAPA